MNVTQKLPEHWEFWTREHPGLLLTLDKDLLNKSTAYAEAYRSILSIFSTTPLLYSKLLSVSSSKDMSAPKLKDYLNWLIHSQDWATEYWRKSGPRPGFFLYLSRSVDRFLEFYNEKSTIPDLGDTQINPITLMASEIYGKVERYADKLDQSTHVCFALHAEGLTTQEIAALTNVHGNLVGAYVQNAKHLIKEGIKRNTFQS